MSRQARTAALVAVAVAVVALIVYVLYPTAVVPPGEGPSAVGDGDRGEDAREIIADLQQSDSVDYDEMFARAETFSQDGEHADAQLLYFFAARNGHAPSAFALASAYDPNHHDPESSLLPEPDPFQAFKWYSQAADSGMSDADERLDALRQWAEQQAAAGNTQAERLLLQWN